MRALLTPAALAAGLSASSLAFAAPQMTTTGSVKAIDAKTHTLTLADGKIYQLPQGFKASGLMTGEKVRISWEMKDGKHEATKITIVK